MGLTVGTLDIVSLSTLYKRDKKIGLLCMRGNVLCGTSTLVYGNTTIRNTVWPGTVFILLLIFPNQLSHITRRRLGDLIAESCEQRGLKVPCLHFVPGGLVPPQGKQIIRVQSNVPQKRNYNIDFTL